ncbi:hypothetical protein [Desulfobulbus alkaliphilus]|uniref:hypothetical protein n=1 Tax=Desulfobulbus alkaliphilus TaxID=869814 RepID=UPI001966589C|nr:hypothetical protein [Desulfobulbus alkaliphilus]MBM9538155.1 hypothetical protein [Desulfobulbus alkaliphilus]
MSKTRTQQSRIQVETTEGIGVMEPMLPPDGERKLEDLALDLASKASGLASQLQPTVRSSIGDLVRSMNCYKAKSKLDPEFRPQIPLNLFPAHAGYLHCTIHYM